MSPFFRKIPETVDVTVFGHRFRHGPYLTRSLPRLLNSTFTTSGSLPPQLEPVCSQVLSPDREGPALISELFKTKQITA